MKGFIFLSMIILCGCSVSNLRQQDKSSAGQEKETKNTKSYETITITCTPCVKVVNPHPPTSAYPTPSFTLELGDDKSNQIYAYFVYDEKLVNSFVPNPEGVGYSVHAFEITPSQTRSRISILNASDVKIFHEGKFVYKGNLYRLQFRNKN